MGFAGLTLVALDNSTFDLLERTTRNNPAEADAFFAAWERDRCVLVVTYTHLLEIAQDADEARLARRMAVIGRFPRILYYWKAAEPLAADEIEAHLMVHIGVRAGLASPAAEVIRDMGDDLLRDVATAACGELFAQHLRRVDAGALAKFVDSKKDTARADQKTRDADMREISRQRVDAAESRARNEEDERALTDDERKARRLERREAAVASWAGHPKVQEFIRWRAETEDAERARGRSDRKVEIALRNLSGTPSSVRAPVADLDTIVAAYMIAKEFIEPRLLPQCGREAFDAALAALDVYNLPGFSVRVAVERGRRASELHGTGSDYLDAALVMVAPYIDVLFADSRTASYFNQARNKKRRGEPDLLPNARGARVVFASTLAQVLEAIRQSRNGHTPPRSAPIG